MYQAFGGEQDLAHARALFAQCLRRAAAAPAHYSAEGIDDLAGIAQLACWLQDAQTAAQSEELLAAADKQLLLQAQLLLSGGSHANRRALFFNILRYFHLRSATHDGAVELHALSQRAQAAYANHEWTPLLPAQGELTKVFTVLGLADGLASEALQLVKLYKAGIQQPVLLKAIESRILAILSTRREVDFSKGIYGMFPDAIIPEVDEAQASQQLTWRGGDLGQALLLYEARVLLQDKELAWLAELVGLNTLLRRDERTTGVRTSAFYAGAAGTAQLYQQLHRTSGNPAYDGGYRYWMRQTQLLLPQDLCNGLYQQGRGLRYDLTGVALVFLSAVAAQPVQWEQRFL